MSLTEFTFKQPLFSDGVFLKFQDTSVEIRYRDRGCSITFVPEDQQGIAQLLRLLQLGGMSPEQLGQACPKFREDLSELLMELHCRDMLTET